MSPTQVTSKNPQRVEAGKKLAEYNRRKREELKQASVTPQKEVIKTDVQRDEAQSSRSDGHHPGVNYVVGGGIALGLVGGFVYFAMKKKAIKPTSVAQQKSKIPVPFKINKLEME